MRALRATGSTFIVLGATMLLFVLYELVGTSAITNGHQRALAEEFDDSIQRASRPSVTTPAAERKKRYKGPPPIAIIKIPSIGVHKYVVEGTSLANLAFGPGHYRSTARPGEPGSVGIAGHRTGWGSPFINLDKLGRGDLIIVQSPKGKEYRYRVTGTKIVEPSAGWVLRGDPDSKAKRKLTLTTCTPKYTSRLRLIVWADQVEG